MPKRLYRISEPAADDLLRIWGNVYSQSRSLRTADRVIDKLFSAFELLGENLEAGHFREDLTELPLRFWGEWSYLIAYRSQKEFVEIARVLHGAQDVATILKGDN